MLRTFIILVLITSMSGFASCNEQSIANPPVDANINQVNSILGGLQKAAEGLKSYQCKVEYLFNQPVLESQTLKKGVLYYAKFGEQSKLRINFETLKQDDEPEQKYIEHYIFDGQWLTQIDYQIKQVKRRQLAEPNETTRQTNGGQVDAFELVKRNFPIIGFSKTDDLKKQFDINLVGEPNDVIHLHLKVKPDSEYKDDYESVDVWIDAEKSGLPAKVTAASTNGDIYEIWLVEPKVNEQIDKKVFDFTIPDGFGKPEVIWLKETKS